MIVLPPKPRSRFVLCALYFHLSAGLSAAEPAPLRLSDAIAEAVQNNLGLLAEKANVSISDARIVTAGLRPNPILSAGADHLDLLGTGFDSSNAAGPPEYSVRMDFPFETAGKRARRVEAATLGRSAVESQVRNAVRELSHEVATLFVDALFEKENLDLARENLSYFDGIVEVNQARFRAGDIAEVELMRSRLAAMQQRTLFKESQLQLHTSLLRLQTAIGRRSLSSDLQLTGDLRRDSALPELQQWLSAAQAGRPDLLALRNDLSRAGAELRLQLAQAKVDPSVGTEYRRQQGLAGKGNSIGVFLEVPLPFTNRNQGEIERARQEKRQAEIRIRHLETLVLGEVRAAFEQARTALDLLKGIEGDLLTQAREVRQVTEFAYRRGHATLLELLDAQRAYQESSRSFISARASFARSLYHLDAAAGRSITQ